MTDRAHVPGEMVSMVYLPGVLCEWQGPNMQNLDDSSSKGILPRVAQCIFEFIQAADETSEFLIKLSMVRISIS